MNGAAGKVSSSLSKRIVSALVLIPLVLIEAYLGSPWFDFMVILFGLVMAWEWVGIAGRRPNPPDPGNAPARALANGFQPAGLALIALVTLALVLARFVFWEEGPWVALFLGLGAICAVLAAWPAQGPRSFWFGLGFLYITVPSLAILWIRDDPLSGLGLETLIWILALVIATDTGAYVAGRSIGGPKLAPSVSPGKTWAGLWGGVVSAALTGLILALAIQLPSYWKIMILSGALAIVEQLGDLFESWIKRRFGVKDSSHIIPGHGGVLDRVDGLLAVAVAVAVLDHLGEGSVLSWL